MGRKAAVNLYRGIKDQPSIIAAFKDAYDSVLGDCGRADEGLLDGELHSKACLLMLEKATSTNLAHVYQLYVGEVRNLQSNSDWDFEYNKEYAWAYWSARHFLALSTKFNLEIDFKY